MPSPSGIFNNRPVASALRNSSVLANDLVERIQKRPLNVDQNLRIANDVDEEDMCQL